MASIYLDNHTTTRPSDLAVSRMMPFFTDWWGVPSAPHQKGQELYPSLEESYQAIYTLLGAKEKDTVLLTSSGAEAVNQVIFSVYHEVTRSTGKNQFLASNVDEAPAILAMDRLQQVGCVHKLLPVGNWGYLTAETLADAVTPRTALVSLSWVNGLTGVVTPLAEIASLCQERGILLHLDATHALGKLFFELEDIGADFISFNGDLFHAPKGTGGLYIKSGTKCSPLIFGGNDQAGYRAGPLNVPGLVGLGVAAQQAFEARDFLCTEIARLRDKLEQEITKGFPDAVPFFRDQERVPNCTAIAFPGIANEAMLFALNRKGIYASIGGGNFQQIGLVLTASGIDETLAQTALSFSLSRETTEEEIDRAAAIIVETAHSLRKVSGKTYKSL